MITFDLKKFKDGKLVVWCNDFKNFYEFIDKLVNMGVMPKDEIQFMNWRDEEEDTCVLYDGEVLYGNRLFYESENDTEVVDYCLLSFENTEPFEYLKEGMVIETRHKKRYLLRNVNGLLFASRFEEYFETNYDEDLCDDFDPIFDVMKVYESKATIIKDLFDDSKLSLIWEREQVEEMTLEEVCKALGKKIKIKED